MSLDLFATPASWHRAFDFVFEAYTLQVLHPNLRPAAVQQIAAFVGAEGNLLLITRGRDVDEDPGQMPWPLIRSELDEFTKAGLTASNFEDYLSPKTRPFGDSVSSIATDNGRPVKFVG